MIYGIYDEDDKLIRLDWCYWRFDQRSAESLVAMHNAVLTPKYHARQLTMAEHYENTRIDIEAKMASEQAARRDKSEIISEIKLLLTELEALK